MFINPLLGKVINLTGDLRSIVNGILTACHCIECSPGCITPVGNSILQAKLHTSQATISKIQPPITVLLGYLHLLQLQPLLNRFVAQGTKSNTLTPAAYGCQQPIFT